MKWHANHATLGSTNQIWAKHRARTARQGIRSKSKNVRFDFLVTQEDINPPCLKVHVWNAQLGNHNLKRKQSRAPIAPVVDIPMNSGWCSVSNAFQEKVKMKWGNKNANYAVMANLKIWPRE